MRKYIKSSKLNDPGALELIERHLRTMKHEYFHALSRTREGLSVSILVGRKLPSENGVYDTIHALVLLGQDIEKNRDATARRLLEFQKYVDEVNGITVEQENKEKSIFIVVRVWESLQEINCIDFFDFKKFYDSLVLFDEKMKEAGWL
jgi:UV DNA damage repair endonuclease